MCPACSVAMFSVQKDGVEVDCCSGCGGTWMDAGELESLIALAGAAPGALTRALTTAGGGPRSRRRCPRCPRRLRRYTPGAQGAPELDRCPRGHGLFFDAGELQAMVEAAAGSESGTVGRYFADLYRHALSRGREEQPCGS